MPKKQKGPDLPPAPQFQPQANVEPNIGFLSNVGRGLASGNFLNVDDPLLGFLNPLVSLQPEITQQSIGLATRDVVRLRDQAQQSILNQLEANNQLNSSVTGNRLSDLNEQFSSDIADIATTFRLADAERALTNIGGLFELGLNTTGQATNLGLSEQSQRNQFSLQNYNNQVAAAIAAQPTSSGGGLLGGAIGTGLGAAIGSVVPGVGTAIGAGIGGAIGSGLGSTISPAQGQVDPGISFIGGGLGVAGAAAGGLFTPTNQFSSSVNSRLNRSTSRFESDIDELINLRSGLGVA